MVPLLSKQRKLFFCVWEPFYSGRGQNVDIVLGVTQVLGVSDANGKNSESSLRQFVVCVAVYGLDTINI